MASPALLKRFTEDDFRQWVERDEHRRDLEREARQLKAENDLVAQDLFAGLEANEKTELVRGEFVGFITERKDAVSWKNEFLRIEGAAAAAKLQAETDTTRFATISRRPA